MRWTIGRSLRLELVAGLGFALALPAIAAESPPALATETALSAETHDVNGQTQVTLSVNVAGQDGQAATGAVVFEDEGKQVAGTKLDGDGHATLELTLAPGEHSFTASYVGDSAHKTSISQVTPVRAATGTTPDFSISVAPATLSLKQGQSGSVVASLTPVNAASLTAPMFVTLSCSGLPDQSSCTFTPENVEILPNQATPITSSMVLATSLGSQRSQNGGGYPVNGPSSGITWAVLLPGTLGLAGLAFGARRRRWLSRLSLLSMVGVVAVLGTAACNPLYYYRNHGPSPNLPTPTGTYTLLVTAQSSNGITATTHSTNMVLTVQ